MHSKPGAVHFRVEASLPPRPAVSASFMRYCLIAPLFTYGALFQRAQAEIQENHAPPSDTGKSTLARLNESDPPPRRESGLASPADFQIGHNEHTDQVRTRTLTLIATQLDSPPPTVLRKVSIGGEPRKSRPDRTFNSGFSSQLNLTAIFEEGEFDFAEDRSAFQSALVVAEPALRFGSLGNMVLEGRFVLRHNRDQSETVGHAEVRTETTTYRDYTRLVVDFPDKPMRIQFGDIFSRSTALQRPASYAGVSISSAAYELQPMQNAFGTGAQTFSLSRDSTVDIEVNGVHQSRLFLEAGYYDIRDIPLKFGANDVDLIIRDTTGWKQKLNLSVFGAPQLLARGELAYEIGLGAQSVRNVEGIDYFSNRPIGLGSLSAGITSNIQIGASLLATHANQSVSLDGRFIGWNGEYAGEVLYQSGKNVAEAVALKANYRSSYVASFPPVRLSAAYYGPGYDAYEAVTEFSRPVSRSLTNPFRFERLWQLDGSITMDYSQDYSLDLGFDVMKYRDTDTLTLSEPEWTAYASAYGSLDNSTLLSVSLSIGRFEADQLDVGAFISLTRRFGGNKTASLKHNTRNNRTRATLGRSAIRYTNDWAGNIGFEQAREFGEQETALVADFELDSNWGTFYADVSAPSSLGPSGSVKQRYSIAEFSTSVGYAGGRVALGSPSGGAFAIIGAAEDLEHTAIVTDYDGEDYSSRSKGRHVQHYSHLLPYRNETLKMTARGPEGEEICEAELAFVPAYKSGRNILVTTDMSDSGSPEGVTADTILVHCQTLDTRFRTLNPSSEETDIPEGAARKEPVQ